MTTTEPRATRSRTAIWDWLHRNPAATRKQIVAGTGLSLSTVSATTRWMVSLRTLSDDVLPGETATRYWAEVKP